MHTLHVVGGEVVSNHELLMYDTVLLRLSVCTAEAQLCPRVVIFFFKLFKRRTPKVPKLESPTFFNSYTIHRCNQVGMTDLLLCWGPQEPSLRNFGTPL